MATDSPELMVKQTLSNLGMRYIRLKKQSQETLQLGDGKYAYEAEYTIEYESRLKIVSE